MFSKLQAPKSEDGEVKVQADKKELEKKSSILKLNSNFSKPNTAAHKKRA